MVLSLSRSLPAVLPSFSVVAVTSRMSSTTYETHSAGHSRIMEPADSQSSVGDRS